MSATTTLLNRLDPRQPSEAEIRAAAEAAVAQFDGNPGKARLWAVDEAIRFDKLGDRQRNLIAVRISRAITEMSRASGWPPHDVCDLSSFFASGSVA